MKRLLIAILVFTLLVTGCVQQGTNTTNNTVPKTTVLTTVATTTVLASTTTIEVKAPETQGYTYYEGDLVDLGNLTAVDPDNDKLIYYYKTPFGKNGRWQTKIGDAGTYTTSVVASDGKANATKTLTIVVRPLNRAPTIDFQKEISVNEGNTVSLNPKVSDPDGDKVDVSYKGFMNTDRYVATYSDAGTYKEQILATDGKAVTVLEVTINIKDVPRAPVFEPVNFDIVAKEGEKINFEAKATSPDEKKVTITYAKPLDSNGAWQTKVGDAGTYEVEITASDGLMTATEKVKIIIEALNHKPKIMAQDKITIKEGENVKIYVNTTDADNDPVTVKFSRWMNSSEYTTAYNDAGTHTVTVSATDGKDTVTKEVTIVVNDVNRAPVIKALQDIKVVEGSLIEVYPIVTDEDVDILTTTYSSPLNSSGKWKTTIGDAGKYVVTVTASDGKDSTSEKMNLIVSPINHAPVIQIDDVTVNEGDTVKLSPVVTDEDNDPLTITYSGWMTSNLKATTYGDFGTYTVTIAASDGKTSTSKDVKVVVAKVNRPPVWG